MYQSVILRDQSHLIALSKVVNGDSRAILNKPQETVVLSADKEEATANQLHVVWPQSTAGLHDDVILSQLDDVTSSLMPFFDDSASFVNVTVQFGANAVLHCRVSELSEKTTVSLKKYQKISVNYEHILPRLQHSYSNFTKLKNQFLSIKFVLQ